MRSHTCREPQRWGKICLEGLGSEIARGTGGGIQSPLPADYHCRDFAGLRKSGGVEGEDFLMLEEKVTVSKTLFDVNSV